MKGTDFDAFFQAVHEASPFPWQTRLANQVCETNEWPAVLDLPTGSGKTSCIDIAIFHWLVSAARGRPADAARRIAFVVDRRIIVDEASERARKIGSAIDNAKDGVLVEARQILADRAGSPTIGVFTLRGGVARERNLVRDPLRLTVMLSTVDQIGSRLLFRGYGVSDGMRPLHAGIFGTDALLLLDEAHIAEPFRQTLEGIVREQGRAPAGSLGPRPLRWAQLSATPSTSTSTLRHFSLDDADRAHPVLARRLTAAKPMRLVEVAKRDELPPKLASLISEELAAQPLADDEHARVGVVVNRVATARALHELLRKQLKGAADVELLIGRVRPLDRDRFMRELAPRLKSSTSPRPGERPIVVVATQTIEVGADFDFHSLFLEAAGYSATKQRTGRLNRLGRRCAARGAIVLVRADKDTDPLYGATIGTTWELLQSHATDGVVDLGIDKAPPSSAETSPESPATPLLSPPLLALLVQTSPRPAVEPDVAEFLHGFSGQVPDVAVVWRDGLVDEHQGLLDDKAAEILRVLPPLSTEAMSVPYGAFRQWAARWEGDKRGKMDDEGDLEGDSRPSFEDERERIDGEVLVVTGEEITRRRADRVRPGDVVVVPASRGGCDASGWHPLSTATVPDLSLAARSSDLVSTSTTPPTRPSRRQREAVLVWTPEIAHAWLAGSTDTSRPALDALSDSYASLSDAREELVAWFDANEASLPAIVLETHRRLSSGRLEWLEDEKAERFGLLLREGRPTGEDLNGETELQRSVNVRLDEHLRTVGELAQAYARSVGLPDSLVIALGLAGSTHDLGKADPRFQQRLGAPDGTLLAKSVTYDTKVPRGERHEAYSVAVLDAHPDALQAAAEHRDLIRYLVGTHHGYGRAAHPQVQDAGVSFSVPHEGLDLAFNGRPRAARTGLWVGGSVPFAEPALWPVDTRLSRVNPSPRRPPAVGARGRRGRAPDRRGPMSRIELTGLIGSHPLGALASFGLLRVVAGEDPTAKLSFVERDDWVAVLDCSFTDRGPLVDFLRQRSKNETTGVFELFGGDDVRIAPSRYRAFLHDALDRERPALDLACLLVGLAADGAEDRSKGLIKPSPFYMASGQQSFLDTMKRIHAHTRDDAVWDEALFGPWRYATSEWGAGWDPGTERMHALRFKAPTKDKTASVAAAVWLAFEALQLFPTFSVAGRVETVGWLERDRLDHFRWPLPSEPLSLGALGVLVAAEELTEERPRARAPRREGLAAVYESTRYEFGQGYAVFRPARRVGLREIRETLSAATRDQDQRAARELRAARTAARHTSQLAHRAARDGSRRP